MRKPAFCICENKDADQLISAFVFAIRIVQFLYYLNPKFQTSSYLLWLYSPVCVGPGRKPEDRFSQNEAHMSLVPSSKILSFSHTFAVNQVVLSPTWLRTQTTDFHAAKSIPLDIVSIRILYKTSFFLEASNSLQTHSEIMFFRPKEV